jgi:hypothetical protein
MLDTETRSETEAAPRGSASSPTRSGTSLGSLDESQLCFEIAYGAEFSDSWQMISLSIVLHLEAMLETPVTNRSHNKTTRVNSLY